MQAVAIVLAAGKGTRMGSELPKVLHEFRGEPLIVHPLRAAHAAGVGRCIVVVGHGAEQVRAAVGAAAPISVEYAVQAEQRGTGHAVLCAFDALGDHDDLVLILSGDVPLLRAATLRALVDACERASAGLSLLSFRPADKTGYGRLLRDASDRPVCIREDRDCTAAEREVDECNAGVYCIRASGLRSDLPQVGTDNDQGEIYLTDLVESRAAEGVVEAIEVDATEVAGINTREQLAELERIASNWLPRDRA